MIDNDFSVRGVPGFKVASVHAGLKAEGVLDFALIVSDTPCVAAGVFTTNLVKAAPVLVDMERLQRKQSGYRAVAINTKCANACTGQEGIDNALQTARWVAERVGCTEDEVLVMSTGVIGTHLAMDKIRRGIDLAVDNLSDSGEAWQNAASAIMTTDTRPKTRFARVAFGDYSYQINGIAKGAGMIAPNMATMLSVIATNAPLTAEGAAQLLRSVTDRSFNRIVVDGDMSTNDTVLLLSNGADTMDAATHANYAAAFEQQCVGLAKMIVHDGEGVTKFITLQILGTTDDLAAKQIANTIATSALVKTAFYGGDANWGRIIAAAGRAGISVAPERMKLWIAGGEENRRELLLFSDGMPTRYDEAHAKAIMREPAIYVTLDCGQGKGDSVVWTCDLSHDYVSINGHYRS